MVLNYIWVAFFLIAFVVAVLKMIITGDLTVFPSMVDATFSSAKTGFELSLGLAGVLTLWLGLMKIGERGGIISIFSRLIGPFFSRLFPEIPKGHPAHGNMMMSFAANMLGLDNAATPLGLKTMESLQEQNPNKDTASNAQIMYLTLLTSGLTMIPISIMMYRTQMGAADPADIFIPILLSTYTAMIVGLIAVAIIQRINLFDKVLLAYLGGLLAFIGGVIWGFSQLSREHMEMVSKVVANGILFTVIVSFIVLGLRKRINLFETFIEGAKEGFTTAVKIIPYLVAMLVGIGVFRASGAMDYVMHGIQWCIAALGFNTDFIPALPTALMKPLSGSGARGMMIDTMKTLGPDSFAGRLSCMFQGATDTTFYIIALYFGSVGIRNSRYAIICGLIADFAGVIAAILLAYLFFH